MDRVFYMGSLISHRFLRRFSSGSTAKSNPRSHSSETREPKPEAGAGDKPEESEDKTTRAIEENKMEKSMSQK